MECGRYISASDQFSYTFGILTDTLDNVYVADSGNNQIIKFIAYEKNPSLGFIYLEFLKI